MDLCRENDSKLIVLHWSTCILISAPVPHTEAFQSPCGQVLSVCHFPRGQAVIRWVGGEGPLWSQFEPWALDRGVCFMEGRRDRPQQEEKQLACWAVPFSTGLFQVQAPTPTPPAYEIQSLKYVVLWDEKQEKIPVGMTPISLLNLKTIQ